MFDSLPNARPARERIAEMRDGILDGYAKKVTQALMDMTAKEMECPDIRVQYAGVDFKDGFLPRDGYVPGDSSGRQTCVPDPEAYTDDLVARLRAMGLVAKTPRKLESASGHYCVYYLMVDNPFTGDRLPCTSMAFWDRYDSAQGDDLRQLVRRVHDFVDRRRGTFTLSTKPIYRRNLEKIAEELRPKGYVCKIYATDGYSMKVSSAE